MAAHFNMVSVDSGRGGSAPKAVSGSNVGSTRPTGSTNSSVNEPNYNNPVASPRSPAGSKLGTSGSGSRSDAPSKIIPNEKNDSVFFYIASDKYINASIWAMTKGDVVNVANIGLKNIIGSHLNSTLSGTNAALFSAGVEALYKVSLAGAADNDLSFKDALGVAAAGFTKSLTGASIKNPVKSSSEKAINYLLSQVSLPKGITMNEAVDILMKQKIGGITANKLLSSVTSSPITLGVDYIGSLASSYAKNAITGKDINLDSLGVGSNALKSTTKILGATVGEGVGGAVGAWLGGEAGMKVGSKVGKTIGTTVGATIAEGQVKKIDAHTVSPEAGEKWAAKAAASELTGAVVGAGVAVAAFAAGVAIAAAPVTLGVVAVGAVVTGIGAIAGAVSGWTSCLNKLKKSDDYRET